MLLLALAVVPQTDLTPVVLEDHVDTIEVMHITNVKGNVMSSYLLFWEIWGPKSIETIVAWRSMKVRPLIIRHNPTAIFYDGQGLRRVRAHSFREVWSDYDREVKNREVFPISSRRGLANESRQPW